MLQTTPHTTPLLSRTQATQHLAAPHNTTTFLLPQATRTRISHAISALAPTLCLLMGGGPLLPTIARAMSRPEIPQITVFHDSASAQEKISASCCIDGTITYLEIYENCEAEAGTYRLESERKAPQPEVRILKLLEQAIIDYSNRENIGIYREADSDCPDRELNQPTEDTRAPERKHRQNNPPAPASQEQTPASLSLNNDGCGDHSQQTSHNNSLIRKAEGNGCGERCIIS